MILRALIVDDLLHYKRYLAIPNKDNIGKYTYDIPTRTYLDLPVGQGYAEEDRTGRRLKFLYSIA